MQNTARKFYSSLGLLIVLNAVIKPLWIFGIDRQVQNTVGTLEYGSYFSLFNLSVVFGFLLDWGLTSFFNRQLASQQENFIRHAGNFLFIKLLLAVLYAAIVVATAFITGIDRWDIVAGVILIQVLTSLFVFLRAIITAEQWFRTDAWLSVLDKTLMIQFCGSLLFFPALFGLLTITKFIWVQVTCTALAVTAAMIVLLQKGVSFSAGKMARIFDRQLFLAAMPYAIILLLMSVHYRMDGFLLERIHPDGAQQAGIYAASYRLLDAANMIAVLFASFLLPYVARQWSKRTDMTSIILQVRHFLLSLSIGAACMAIFLAPWIQQLLYHHTDADGIKVLQWCLPALIGYSLVAIYGTVMTATGHIRPFCIITLATVMINLSLNLFLIPSLGAKGCCIAALISQCFCGILTMLYVKQKLQVGLHGGSLLMYIFIGLVLSALFYWGGKGGINPWWLIIAGIIVTWLLLVVTRLVRPVAWIASLRNSHL